ncbi:MAG: hypothetical protein IH944_06455 [Armatimonadetes bacterium]|nr:hypothetical protein [Armatimonadota bacterium]
MYGKRFLLVSRISVYFAVIALIGVTLFGSIAPASPLLERTKRNLERDGVYFEWRLFEADTLDEVTAAEIMEVDGYED